MLGINHQSPLIHFDELGPGDGDAGNQSPIPFDTLTPGRDVFHFCWESITNPL